MRTPFRLVLVIGLVLEFARLSGQGQAPASREARWLEDLNVFAAEFSGKQKDFAKLYPDFNQDLAALRKTAATAPDTDVIFGLMRLVAGAHVAHTTVNFPQGPLAFHRLPVSLNWFEDGLAVVGASAPYHAGLGAQVVRIGSMTPAALEAAIAPFISHENAPWLRQQSPRYMVLVELLRHVGAIPNANAVPVTLTKPGQAPFVLELTPAEPAASVQLTSMYDVLPIPAMLYRKNLQRNYWFEYLPDARAVYIQYNRCQDDPNLPMSEFARQVFAVVDASPVDRLVVDLRLNQGGNSTVIAPLLAGLKARPALVRTGRLVTLIGRATFSSGLIAAFVMKNDFGSALIGEPTGEKPNSYGEVLQVTLPHSRVNLSYTTKFFRLARDGDPIALFPDVTVTRSLPDALAGRDPVLDAALKRR
jgi:hypothetical protein